MIALRRLPVALLSGLVRGYRLLLQPWIGNVCRFEPTCSAYALQALQRHGALRGTALASARILRCNPWCAGGHDAVPDNFGAAARGLFTRLTAGAPVPSRAAAVATRPGFDPQHPPSAPHPSSAPPPKLP